MGVVGPMGSASGEPEQQVAPQAENDRTVTEKTVHHPLARVQDRLAPSCQTL
jgi:hypothetical protein